MDVKFCVDKFIDPVQAANIAVDESADNAPDLSAAAGVLGNHSRDLKHAGVILTGRKWAQKRNITISFMGGDSKVIHNIKSIAENWLSYINLTFEWVDRDGDIRIAFDENDGSWSYLGTSNLAIPKSEPTMNFGWLFPDTDLVEYRRTVLHEFGHMLGFPHEHMHPRHDIPYDKPATYALYWRSQGWSKEEVDQQVIGRYAEDQTQFSQSMDKESIMLYPIPNEITIGDYEVGWNTTLSPGDKAFAAWQYPRDPEPVEPPKPPVRKKVTLTELYRSPRSYYGKQLEIQTGSPRTTRWVANPMQQAHTNE